MRNPQFNPSKIYKDARSWMALSKQIIFDGARETLKTFADGGDLKFGLVDVQSSFRDLSVWYQTAFIVEANEGLDTAANSLSLSFDCDLWEALSITRYWSPLAEVPFGKGLDDYAQYLSKGLSIGAF